MQREKIPFQPFNQNEVKLSKSNEENFSEDLLNFGRISRNDVSRKAILGHCRAFCGFLSSVQLITTKALLKKLFKSSSNLRNR